MRDARARGRRSRPRLSSGRCAKTTRSRPSSRRCGGPARSRCRAASSAAARAADAQAPRPDTAHETGAAPACGRCRARGARRRGRCRGRTRPPPPRRSGRSPCPCCAARPRSAAAQRRARGSAAGRGPSSAAGAGSRRGAHGERGQAVPTDPILLLEGFNLQGQRREAGRARLGVVAQEVDRIGETQTRAQSMARSPFTGREGGAEQLASPRSVYPTRPGYTRNLARGPRSARDAPASRARDGPRGAS